MQRRRRNANRISGDRASRARGPGGRRDTYCASLSCPFVCRHPQHTTAEGICQTNCSNLTYSQYSCVTPAANLDIEHPRSAVTPNATNEAVASNVERWGSCRKVRDSPLRCARTSLTRISGCGVSGPRNNGPFITGDQHRRKVLHVDAIDESGLIFHVDPQELDVGEFPRDLVERCPVLATGRAPFGTKARNNESRGRCARGGGGLPSANDAIRARMRLVDAARSCPPRPRCPCAFPSASPRTPARSLRLESAGSKV